MEKNRIVWCLCIFMMVFTNIDMRAPANEQTNAQKKIEK